jgi:uncharacterized protein YdhG (YjbR/CyaY superfamily)
MPKKPTTAQRIAWHRAHAKACGCRAIPAALRATPPRKAATIDEYLAGVMSGETRRALERLRQTIRRIVPDAEECISYAMPAFRVGGRVVAGFAGRANGGSYYPFSGTTLQTLASELAGYDRTSRRCTSRPRSRPRRARSKARGAHRRDAALMRALNRNGAC